MGAIYPVQGSSPDRPLETVKNRDVGASAGTASFWFLLMQRWGDYFMRGALTTFCLAMANAAWVFRARPSLRAPNV